MWGWVIVGFMVAAIVAGTVAYILLGADTSQLGLVTGGVTAFNGVQVVDTQGNAKAIVAGSILRLQYFGSGAGSVMWQYREGDTSVWQTIVQSTRDNPIEWRVPGTVFGALQFRVVSVSNLNVKAVCPPPGAAAITVVPVVTWQGTGDFDAEHFVVLGAPVDFTYQENGTWIEENGVNVLLADGADAVKTWAPADQSTVVVNTDAKKITWTPTLLANGKAIVEGDYTLQITTTDKKKLGKPTELTFVMSNQVHIGPSTGANTNGKFCTITVTSATSVGRQTVFSPTEALTLTISDYLGDLPTHDWWYSTDAGVSWTSIVAGVETAATSWVVPGSLLGKFQLRAVAAGVDPRTRTSALFSQLDLTIGVYLTLQGDAAHRDPVVDYRGVADAIVASVTVYVVGCTNRAALSDAANWTIGWYTSPKETDPRDRILACRVVGLTATTGPPLPANTSVVALDYVDEGYRLGAVQVPLYVEVRVPAKSTGSFTTATYVTQAVYTLKP